MQTARLKPVHVYIIGLVVAFIFGIVFFFALINPALGQVTQLKTQESQLLTNLNGNPEKAEKDAQKAKENAQTQATSRTARWRSWDRRQSPPPRFKIPTGDYFQRVRAPMDKWWELPTYIRGEVFRYAITSVPRVRRGWLEFMEDPGEWNPATLAMVRRRGWIRVKRPQSSPDPRTIPPELVKWNLGQVYVDGSFSDAMNWVRKWNQFKYTTVLDNLSLQLIDKGMVRAKGNLIVYIWTTQKPSAGGGAAPEGGEAAGGGSGGGPALPGTGGPPAGSSGRRGALVE
jgi:hypothetical protein